MENIRFVLVVIFWNHMLFMFSEINKKKFFLKTELQTGSIDKQLILKFTKIDFINKIERTSIGK